jgi:hypothetical protein
LRSDWKIWFVYPTIGCGLWTALIPSAWQIAAVVAGVCFFVGGRLLLVDRGVIDPSQETLRDDFDPMFGGDLGGPPVPLDRGFFLTGAVIFGWFPAVIGSYLLVRWLS